MNKNIKALASAKAKKYGGEDSAGYRKGRGAKPYHTERVSQTETPQMGTVSAWVGSESMDNGKTFNEIGGTNLATYNADNKAISASIGRRIAQNKKYDNAYGISDKVSGLGNIRQINQENQTIIKPSWTRIYGKKKAAQLESRAFKAGSSSGFNKTVDWKSVGKKGLTSFRRGGVSKAAGESNYQNWKEDYKGR